MHERIYKIKEWIKKYERHLSSLALLSGFTIDALTLKRVDALYENLVLLGYFSIIIFGIILLNLIESRRYVGIMADRIATVLPLFVQFAFGGLFSGFTIFYFKSGSIVASWPFIIILLSLLVANELLRKQYARLVFQLTILFVALFFFMIFFVPVLIDNMGPWVFVLSGIVAIICITLFIYVLSLLVYERIHNNKKYLGYSIAAVYLLINILYFTNLIPPIPLSLKDTGVYHSLIRSLDGYVVMEEEMRGWASLQIFENIHVRPGDSLYVYSAVFAPTDIKADIVHHWRYFDEANGRWVSASRIPYTITGGTDRGYRGYTMKTNLREGEWTVNIETSRGQIIGRVTFEIVYVDQLPELVEKTI